MSQSVVGIVNGGPAKVIFKNIELDSTDAFYIGEQDTEGSWRFIRSGNDLVFQRLESSVWTTKSTISA